MKRSQLPQALLPDGTPFRPTGTDLLPAVDLWELLDQPARRRFEAWQAGEVSLGIRNRVGAVSDHEGVVAPHLSQSDRR